ncbi:hypothetical protein BC829DRAFT_363277, partial [Chytridium lagenaria]
AAGNKVFLGGLSSSVTDAILTSSLSVYGHIAEAKVMMDRTTGRSRGFAFVVFGSDSRGSGMDAVSRIMDLQKRTGGVNVEGKLVSFNWAVLLQ